MKKSLGIALMAIMPLFMSCTTSTKEETMKEKETTVIDAIMSRRSIRHYTGQPVSRELLQKIAECGVNAPNARNLQEWELRIIDSKEYLDGVTEIMKEEMPFFVDTKDPKFRNGFRNATAVIVIACPDAPNGMTLLNLGFLGVD